MLLTLDIGNSEITVGLFRGDTLTAHWRLTTSPDRTSDEWGMSLGAFLLQAGHSPNEVRAACIASVAPQVTRSFIAGVQNITGVRPLEITSGTPLPVQLDVDEPLSVGADRIVNALAAMTIFRTDTVVVDFGTATTFDCVTADGRFIGGAIMPGLRTSADQLTRRTAKLPATDLAPPASAIGRRTDDCIRAGVLYGTADAVDGMIVRVRTEWPGGKTPTVVATGGLAPVVTPFTRLIDSVDPDLTLRGLRLAAGHLGLEW
ncbi:MAG: type III pantothenate kinase [Gemmatimonadales bacterium]